VNKEKWGALVLADLHNFRVCRDETGEPNQLCVQRTEEICNYTIEGMYVKLKKYTVKGGCHAQAMSFGLMRLSINNRQLRSILHTQHLNAKKIFVDSPKLLSACETLVAALGGTSTTNLNELVKQLMQNSDTMADDLYSVLGMTFKYTLALFIAKNYDDADIRFSVNENMKEPRAELTLYSFKQVSLSCVLSSNAVSFHLTLVIFLFSFTQWISNLLKLRSGSDDAMDCVTPCMVARIFKVHEILITTRKDNLYVVPVNADGVCVNGRVRIEQGGNQYAYLEVENSTHFKTARKMEKKKRRAEERASKAVRVPVTPDVLCTTSTTHHQISACCPLFNISGTLCDD
jgi:hypothetical protein